MPKTPRLVSVQDVRPHNRAAMLRRLRLGPSTRLTLARELNLSHSAVSNVAGELLSDGVLVERAVSPSPTRIGRPSTELAIAARSRAVLAVELRRDSANVAVCDLLGTIIDSRAIPFTGSDQPATVVAAIAEGCRNLTDTRPAIPFLGIGVGVPGPVDSTQRVLRGSVTTGWGEVPVADLLESALSLPVVVEHDVRAMALAEARFGAIRGLDSLAFVSVDSHGVGAGLVIDGAAYRGGTGAVTALGHIPIVADGLLCTCGNRGCLQTVASISALARVVQDHAATSAGANLRRHLAEGHDALDALALCANEGDPVALRVEDRFIRHLAIGVATLINLLNVELVIIGGAIANTNRPLLGLLHEAVASRVFPILRPTVRIESTSFETPGLAGAATVALDTFFYDLEPNKRARSDAVAAAGSA